MENSETTSSHTAEPVVGSQLNDRHDRQDLPTIDDAIGQYNARGREEFLKEALADDPDAGTLSTDYQLADLIDGSERQYCDYPEDED